MTKILVVDDHETSRNVMRLWLEADGYDVFTAENSEVAMEAFWAHSPDIVLLGQTTGEMERDSVIESMAAVDPHARLLVTSSGSEEEIAVACLRGREAGGSPDSAIGDSVSEALKHSRKGLQFKRRLRKYLRDLENQVREAHISLERVNEFSNMLIESCPDAIGAVDRSGVVIVFSSAAEKLLGYQGHEIIGRMNVSDLYPPGLAKEIMKDLRSDSFGPPGVIRNKEIVVLDKSALEIPAKLSAALLYEDGKEAGSMGILTDLREKKGLERQLLRAEKLTSLGKLAAGIAHEINQPLTGVLTFASLLAQKFKNDPSTAKDLETIVRETSRIRKIVRGVLDFAQDTPLHKAPISVDSSASNSLRITTLQFRRASLMWA